MKELFETGFGFSTELFQIPHADDAESLLDDKITEIKNKFRAENNLVLIYYGGHGDFDKRENYMWLE